MKPSKSPQAFTLIELLTVIAIIAVLMGLLFPAVSTAMDKAKQAEAKNAILGIVTSIKAYYTDYGSYPCAANTGDNSGDYFAKGASGTTGQDVLFNILRSQKVNGTYTPEQTTYNPRRTVYIDIPNAKETATTKKKGVGTDGVYYDPWGAAYRVRIDSNYNNEVVCPYSANAGGDNSNGNALNTAVIVWSLGKDGDGAKDATGAGDKNVAPQLDDIISWQ